MNRRLSACAAALFLFVSASAAAQELRALVADIVTLSPDKPGEAAFSLASNELLVVVYPKESPFIQGFEIELKLPPAMLSVPGGFAYELWRRITPAPSKNRYAYKGDRLLIQALPARAGLVLQLPVRGDHRLKTSPYAILIPIVIAPADFPFAFRLVSVSKGQPGAAESASYQLRLRPLLSEEGALRVVLRYPELPVERGAVIVAVDEKRVDPASPIMLKSGPHRLVVKSEAYRDEVRAFTIEQGRTLELVVELQDTTPLLLLEAPDSAQITLDGVRIDHAAKASMNLEPGEHSIVCRIGDYTLSRSFTAARGKTYKIVLSVDLRIEEGP